MPALVPELVNMASDPNVSTADLLRRALVVARRLDVPDLVDWIASELNGYRGDVPDYRCLFGELMVFDDVRGHYIQCETRGDPEVAAVLRFHKEHQSVSVLEQIAAGTGSIVRHFPLERERELMASMPIPLRPAVVFSKAQVLGIIDSARNRVLDWALDLEGRGIIGEGMSFTPQEKQAVQQQHYHFGNVSGSQIQIGSNGSTQTQANTTSIDLEALGAWLKLWARPLTVAPCKAMQPTNCVPNWLL